MDRSAKQIERMSVAINQLDGNLSHLIPVVYGQGNLNTGTL